MDRGSQPQSRKRARVSIGELEPKDAATAEDLLDEAAKTLETLDKESISEVTEVSQAIDIVKNASKTAKRVKMVRSLNPGFKVKAISFSSVTAGHYRALGILTINNVMFKFDHGSFKNVVDNLLGNVKGFKHPVTTNAKMDLKVVFNGYWKDSSVYFLRMLEALFACDGGYNEAQARIIIDQFFSQIIQLMYLHAQPVQLIPEMVVSSIDDKNPCIITYEKNKTILTGRIDYAVLAALDPVPEGEELNSKSLGSNSLLKLMNAIKLGEYLRVFFVEAKNVYVVLEEFVPQVVVEATAAIEVLASAYSEISAMGWCLTDGVRWIFGVVSLQKGNGTRVVYRTQIIDYVRSDLKNIGVQAAIKWVLTLLVLWSTTAPEVLINLFA